MSWKFNKDNWEYTAEDNIEEFLKGAPEVVPEQPPKKSKRTKKEKAII